jgi:predicted DsbA family dithiol-disulfide isomerase
MKVEIWSDVVCPWCHIGKRRFETALAQFPHRDAVEVEWKAFELDPGARSAAAGDPVSPTGYAERLARKYGTSVAGGQQMTDHMTQQAAGERLDFRFDRAVPANTFDAHQVIHLAAERGVQDAVKERLMAGYLQEGVAIGLPEELAPIAVEAGLDADEVAAVLDGDAYADGVRADEDRALDIGITGVPFFVVDGRFAIPGAQDADTILSVLNRAWERRSLEVVGSTDAADSCEGDACAT